MGKKGKKKEPEIDVDNINTTELKVKDLEMVAIKIQELIEEEIAQRNQFQTERDKMMVFWEINRKDLEELKNELRNIEKEKEEQAEKCQGLRFSEIQKAKYLQHELTEGLCIESGELQSDLRLTQNKYEIQEAQLLKDKKELQDKLREQETSSQEEIRKVKLKHLEKMHKLREDFEQRCKELVESKEFYLQEHLTKLNSNRLSDVKKLERTKNEQILSIIKDHQSEYDNLKSYYNSITLDNLAQINELQNVLGALQVQKERADKVASDSAMEAKSIAEQLAKATDELAAAKKSLQTSDKNKACLQKLKQNLSIAESRYQQIKWDYEVQSQRYERILVERSNLEARLNKAVLELQQRAALKGTIAKKCGRLNSNVEKEE